MCHLWRLALILISIIYFSEQAVHKRQLNFGKYDEENGNCTCVPFHLCKNWKLDTNNEWIINIRMNNGLCDHYMDVCCKIEEQPSKSQTTTSSPSAVKRGCGYRQSSGVGFKITGDNQNESQFGEFPWVVSLLSNDWYECGGSLIHPQVVITAAHCITNLSCSYKVRAGEWDYQHNNEPYPYQDRNVKSITIHPQYYIDYIINDIAILILESPVEITEHINVICLPPQNAFVDAGKCYSTGWNKRIKENEVQHQTILKKVRHFQIPRMECEETLRLACVNDEYELHESVMCARPEVESDICEEDEGSPLVCPIKGEENRYYQAGVVVLGTNCGTKNFPVLYVNIANFRGWIDEQMHINGFEYPSYLPYGL